MIMWRRLRFALALSALLLANGCDEGKGSSSSDTSSAQTASSATTSGASSPPSQSPPPPQSSGSAGILDASWVAPTTNADGSALNDLAFYRLYFDTSSTPCQRSAFFQVASPTSSPASNQTVTYQVTGLLAGARYFAAVTAVDSSGLESACSPVASAVARSDSGSAAVGMSGSFTNSGVFGNATWASQDSGLTLTGLMADSGPRAPGATVTFTATAAGGTGPYEFKWWLWDGAAWTVLEDWSTGNTTVWTPSTPNPNSAIGVWVRSAGSSADLPDGYPANTRSYGTIAFAID